MKFFNTDELQQFDALVIENNRQDKKPDIEMIWRRYFPSHDKEAVRIHYAAVEKILFRPPELITTAKTNLW